MAPTKSPGKLIPWLYAITCCMFVFTVAACTLACSRSSPDFVNITKVNYLLTAVGLSLVVIVFCLLVAIFHDKKIFFRFSNTDALVLIWLVYIIVNCLVRGGSFRSTKFIGGTLCFVDYLLVRIFISINGVKKIFVLLACTLCLCSIAECIIAGMQCLGIMPSLNELFSITGTFKNPAPLALFLAACFPFPLVIVLFFKKCPLKYLSLLGIMLALTTIAITGNRTSIIAIFISTTFLFIVRYKGVLQSWKDKLFFFKHQAACISITLIISGLLIAAITRSKITSADGRLLVWEITLMKIPESLLFGQGYGAFEKAYNKWQIVYFASNPAVISKQYLGDKTVADFAGYTRSANNDYLEMVVEQGLCGLIIYILIVISCVLRAYRSFQKKTKIPLLTSFVSLLTIAVLCCSSYPFNSIPTFLLFFIFIALIASTDISSKPWSLKGNIGVYLILMFFLILGVGFGVLSINRFKSYSAYVFANELRHNNQNIDAEVIYKDLYPDLRIDPGFLLNYAMCLADNDKLSESLACLRLARESDTDPRIYMISGNIYKMQGAYHEAEESYMQASLIEPALIYPKYLLFNLYYKQGETIKAFEMAKNIASAKPKVTNQISVDIISEMKDFVKTH